MLLLPTHPRPHPSLHLYMYAYAGLELGGLLGGTLSGVLSDKTIRAAKSNPNAGLVGRRVQICMAYTVACIGVLMALKGVPAGGLYQCCDSVLASAQHNP